MALNSGDSYRTNSFAVDADGRLITVDGSYTAQTSGSKSVTTAGTRERLVSVSTPCKGVHVTALSTNTQVVVLGGSTVVAAAGTRVGSPVLEAGDGAFIPIDDAYKVYLDVTVNGEGVSYTLYT